MARELDIAIEVHTAQAEQALDRVEQGLKHVEQSAMAVHGPLTKLETQAQDQARQFDAMRASLTRTDEALKKKKDTLDKVNPAVGELTSLVRQYAGPAVIGLAIKQTL